MNRKEYGWCDHLGVTPFYRPGGSTALRVTFGDEVIMWWVNEHLCFMACGRCYARENFNLMTAGSSSLPIPEQPM